RPRRLSLRGCGNGLDHGQRGQVPVVAEMRGVRVGTQPRESPALPVEEWQQGRYEWIPFTQGSEPLLTCRLPAAGRLQRIANADRHALAGDQVGARLDAGPNPAQRVGD